MPRAALAFVRWLLAVTLLVVPIGASAADPPAPGAATEARPRDPATPERPSIIRHDLAGRAACRTCHGVAGKHPYPADHESLPVDRCLRCHVASKFSRLRGPETPVPPTVTSTFCLACHGKPALSMVLPSGEKLDLHVDYDEYTRSVHGMKGMSCTACHPTDERYPHEKPQGSSARELNRVTIQSACAACHAEVFAAYRQSVHGQALVLHDNLDVPACTDCHGIHDIRDPRTMLFRLDSPDTCTTCHADAKLMAKYDLSPNVTKTYLADFHGKTVESRRRQTPGFASYEAVCYDCHGIHDIKKASDPESSVVKANLVETCRRCHAGAQDNFPAAWMGHYEPDRKSKWALVFFVTWFYKLLIPSAVLGMAGYIGLDLLRATFDKVQVLRGKKAPEPREHEGERMFRRFSFSQCMEHLVEIVSFTALTLTGLPQLFASTAPGEWALRVLGGIDVARGIHRTFGVVMLAQAVYHFGALGISWARGRLRPTIVPKLQDGFDALGSVLFLLGLRKERPRFDRYDFKQKMEYVLLLWGSILMSTTGLVLWFAVFVTRYVPGQIVPAARVAHAGEAILAAFSIVVWHMYFAHLNPTVFPFDRSIFTGKVSETRMREEHPLELERILAAEAAPKAPPPSADAPKPAGTGVGTPRTA